MYNTSAMFVKDKKKKLDISFSDAYKRRLFALAGPQRGDSWPDRVRAIPP